MPWKWLRVEKQTAAAAAAAAKVSKTTIYTHRSIAFHGMRTMRQNVFVCLFVDFYLAIRFICHTIFFFSTSKHIRTLNNFIIFNVQIGYYLVFESKRRPFENVTTVKYFSLKLTTSNGNVCVCILFLLLSCERCPGFCYTCSQIYFKFFFSFTLYCTTVCICFFFFF